MSRAQKYLRARWGRVSGVAGAIIGAVFHLFYLRRPAVPNIVPEAYVPPPPASTAVAVESNEERLAKLRNEAQSLCNQQQYEACAAVLDEAKAIDRDSEYQPDVVKMRHAIDNANRKPRPPKP
jgi:hypothetical protein